MATDTAHRGEPTTEIKDDNVWIGIDFGTTNSAMAVYDRIRGGAKWMRFLPSGNLAQTTDSGKAGRSLPMVLLIATPQYVELHCDTKQQRQNKKMTPWMDWQENGETWKVLVGQSALDLLDSEEDQVWQRALVSSVKRRLLEGNDTLAVTPAGRSQPVAFSIVALISLFLSNIQVAATLYLHTTHKRKKVLDIPHYDPSATPIVQHAVLGIPAAAPVHVKQQLRKAAATVFTGGVEFCTESTAAAMAYGLALDTTANSAQESTILVFDMGGGTTDVTVASKDNQQNSNEVYRVLQTAGDNALGGDDVDRAIQCHCFPESDGKNVALLRACRQAKEELCTENAIRTEQVSIVWQGQRVTLTDQGFLQVLQPILRRIQSLVHSVATAHTTVNTVIFIGGSSRVPAFQETVRACLLDSAKCCRSLHPSAAVAQGCAVAAAAGRMVPLYELRNAFLLDTNPHAIGVLTTFSNKTSFVEILSAGAHLPARGSATFVLADAHQPGVSVDAVEVVGNNDDKPQYNPLGTFTFLLHRLPASKSDGARSVKICMLLNEAGEFTVSVFDEKDPEHMRRKIGAESLGHDAGPKPREQVLLLLSCAAVFLLYITVKMVFPEAGLGLES